MTTTKELSLDHFKRATYNPREDLKPGDREWNDLVESYRQFGQARDFVGNKRTGNLVSGHQGIAVMRHLGHTKGRFHIVDLGDDDEKKLNLVLNYVTGRTDDVKLADLLREMQGNAIDLTALGFSAVELNAILNGKPKATKRDPDDAPRAPDDEKALTRTGDIYDIRTDTCHHRLMCGSSTEAKDMAKLCGETKARVVFTDPPFGISYRGNVTDAIRGVRPQSKTDLISNDELKGPRLLEFLSSAYSRCGEHTRQDAAFYSFCARNEQNIFQEAIAKSGWRLKQVIVWCKSMVIGRSDYHWSHEPILYGAKMGQNCEWLGTRTETTIFETTAEDIAKLSKDQMRDLLLELKSHTTAWEEKKDPPSILQHPNQKPVSLASRALRNSTLPGDHCLEPFAGSGSTIIACELQNRNCLAIELSRGHCDSIIRRFAETFETVTFRRNGKRFNAKEVHAQ